MPATMRVPTVGEIARRLGAPLHRIEYVIRARGIQAANWAGNAKVYTEADVDLIAEELGRIDAARAAEERHRAGRRAQDAARTGAVAR